MCGSEDHTSSSSSACPPAPVTEPAGPNVRTPGLIEILRTQNWGAGQRGNPLKVAEPAKARQPEMSEENTFVTPIGQNAEWFGLGLSIRPYRWVALFSIVLHESKESIQMRLRLIDPGHLPRVEPFKVGKFLLCP